MCAAQSNAPASFGTYTATWGYADNSRGESVVEISSPNINYTVSESVRKLCWMKKFVSRLVFFFFRSNSHKLVESHVSIFLSCLFIFLREIFQKFRACFSFLEENEIWKHKNSYVFCILYWTTSFLEILVILCSDGWK